jgi:succinylglutamate desuccinylase
MQIAKDPTMPGVIRVSGPLPGPRAVMFAGVHGDEVSGLHAVEKLLYDLLGGDRTLLRGTLTLARGNAEAFRAVRRYVKLNMNRLFKDEYASEIDTAAYEFQRAQELKAILRDCDYFLDFHSAPIAQEPFLVAEGKSLSFFTGLGLPRIITGWSNFSAGPTGGDAETYASTHGAIAATLESGSHFDKGSNDVAYAAALSFLTILDMISEDAERVPTAVEIFEMYSVVTKEADDFRYSPNVRNFQFIRKGESFANQDGKPVTVDEDTYLLIPMEPEKTKLHEEVCYLGRKIALQSGGS